MIMPIIFIIMKIWKYEKRIQDNNNIFFYSLGATETT